MKLVKKTGTRGVFFAIGKAAMAFAYLSLFSGSALAQSAFDCRGIDQGPAPLVEGKNGIFFRVDPDMMMYHRVSDITNSDLEVLNDTLNSNGTRLVIVPVPTKSIVMENALPDVAAVFGYDPDLSVTMYQDNIRRFADRGILAIDVRRAILASKSARAPYFATDPRLTNAGLETIAEAIGEVIAQLPQYETFETAQFETKNAGLRRMDSDAHEALQQKCLISLPSLEDTEFETSRVEASTSENAEPAPVTIVSGEMTGATGSNFAGFVAQASNLEVAQYHVQAPAIRAIESYLSSDAFQAQPPAVIIWEVPIWENLAIFGDQPIRAAIAASSGQCRTELPVQPTQDGKWTLDLSSVSNKVLSTLLVETNEQSLHKAQFEFRSSQGAKRTRTIELAPEIPPAKRFFMPLTGLWSTDLASVEVSFEVSLDAPPTMFLCGGDK